MERFEEFKTTILERAKKECACKEQYSRALKSDTFEDLMSVIKDNFLWATENKIIDPILINEYKQEFNGNNIWCNENARNGFLLLTGNTTAEATGNTTVRAYDNATVEAYDNTTVEAYDNAYIHSYYIIECKLKDNSIYRLISENKIFYPEESAIKIEKQTNP